MYPRTNYEMSEADLATLLNAMKSVPAMMIGGTLPSSQQDNANHAWAALGTKMGFDHMTVRPIVGQGNRFFSAVPSENETQRGERRVREAEAARIDEIKVLEAGIAESRKRIAALTDHTTKDDE